MKTIRSIFIKIPFLARVYLIIKYQKPLIFLRIQKPLTKLFGKKYKRSREFIEIDITYKCNKKCMNCNRSCKQAPSDDYLKVNQIKKFINESINKKIKWKRIRLVGGEPTLNPDIKEILKELLKYKKKYSQKTEIQLTTSGFGKKVNKILSTIPKEIEIENSSKKISSKFFHPFNIAPKDCKMYRYADYSNGCYITSVCGIGLTPYGYYHCAIAGSIDRVFGFDIGRKKIPSNNDEMRDQMKIFCGLCGHFRYALPVNKEKISITWKIAYKKYKRKKPSLSGY